MLTGVPLFAGSSNRISPPAIRAAFGRIPMIDWETTDLPEPDSPTSATVVPARIRKLTSRTATICPSGRSNTTLRLRTWSRGRVI